MSTEKTEIADDGVWDAKLVRGKTYVFKGATFRAGESRKVSTATKEYLEENAYDDVAVSTGNGDEMEIDRRGKFEFTKPGAAPVAATRARKR